MQSYRVPCLQMGQGEPGIMFGNPCPIFNFKIFPYCLSYAQGGHTIIFKTIHIFKLEADWTAFTLYETDRKIFFSPG